MPRYHAAMDQQWARDIMSGRRRGPAAAMLRAGLAAASLPYAGIMRARRWAYRRGIIASHNPPADVPVICVGNITTGGSGKTPMVARIVELLRRHDRRPMILTRGYKGSDTQPADEAQLLAQLTGVNVIVNADRLAGAADAVRQGADVLVMDDGFQHRRLRRQLDIVLIDATNPFGFGWCLPRGLLREPASALADADAIVITRSDQATPESLEALRARLAKLAPRALHAEAAHRPVKLIDADGNDLPLDALAGRRVCAFCGIANPDSFFTVLERLNARLERRVPLADHVAYTPRVLAELSRGSGDCTAEVLVTTQKDRVKLHGATLARPLWTLVVELSLTRNAEELEALVLRTIGGATNADAFARRIR